MTDHHQHGDDRTADRQPGWTPSRRAVLAMGGAAVGGTMATLGVGAARAETRPARPTALPEGPGTGGPLLDGSRFPIGAFWPPPPLQITNERYRELARAGITYLHTGNYGWADTQIVQHSLRIADEEGLQVLVDDPDIRWLTRNVSISDSGGDLTVTRSEAEQVLRAVINRYRPVSWWQIVDGQLLITGGTGNGSIGIAKAGANWTDYTMSFTTRPRATGAGGYAQSGWAFRVTDNDNAYVWLLSNQTGPGNLVKAVFVNGQPTVTTVALDIAVNPDTDYKISTEVRGSTITTKINGTVVDTTTEAPSPAEASGSARRATNRPRSTTSGSPAVTARCCSKRTSPPASAPGRSPAAAGMPALPAFICTTNRTSPSWPTWAPWPPSSVASIPTRCRTSIICRASTTRRR
ncbi:hypothetical protein ACQCX2_05170 [Propionibacteriaceae bacterium Y1700]|uniref:hypothetical protein n=1 Tax=Microlunatus sp. Y1700 TaxID=3418487 RepID=UPI003DA74C20